MKRADRRRAARGPGGRAVERSELPEGGSPRVGPVVRDVLVLAAVFGIAVGIAELAGAANLGVSFGIGQVCFALAVIVLLTRD